MSPFARKSIAKKPAVNKFKRKIAPKQPPPSMPSPRRNNRALCVVLVAPYTLDEAQKVVQSLPEFMQMTGNTLHLCLPGYFDADSPQEALVGIGDGSPVSAQIVPQLSYSPTLFVKNVKELSTYIKWDYKTGVSLLIFDIDQNFAIGRTLLEVLSADKAYIDHTMLIELDGVKRSSLVHGYADLLDVIRDLAESALDGGALQLTEYVSDRLFVKKLIPRSLELKNFTSLDGALAAIFPILNLRHFSTKDRRR